MTKELQVCERFIDELTDKCSEVHKNGKCHMKKDDPWLYLGTPLL